MKIFTALFLVFILASTCNANTLFTPGIGAGRFFSVEMYTAQGASLKSLVFDKETTISVIPEGMLDTFRSTLGKSGYDNVFQNSGTIFWDKELHVGIDQCDGDTCVNATAAIFMKHAGSGIFLDIQILSETGKTIFEARNVLAKEGSALAIQSKNSQNCLLFNLRGISYGSTRNKQIFGL